MFAWLVQTFTLRVWPAPGLCMLGWFRHLLFEFGQHLGYVRLVGSDIYSLSLANTWAMFAWLVQTFTL